MHMTRTAKEIEKHAVKNWSRRPLSLDQLVAISLAINPLLTFPRRSRHELSEAAGNSAKDRVSAINRWLGRGVFLFRLAIKHSDDRRDEWKKYISKKSSVFSLHKRLNVPPRLSRFTSSSPYSTTITFFLLFNISLCVNHKISLFGQSIFLPQKQPFHQHPKLLK